MDLNYRTKLPPFENIKIPYYVRDGILMFYNPPDENIFYIGYGDMYNGKYYCSCFRWIKTKAELVKIFEAVKGKDFYSKIIW